MALAQLNIAIPRFQMDAPEMLDFVNNLQRINALADTSPGFLWRYVTPENDTVEAELFGKGTLVNLSLWENMECLHNYVYRTAHTDIMRRRKEWFLKSVQSHMVLWTVPSDTQPTLVEAQQKLTLLRQEGPGPTAFTFKTAGKYL